MSNSMRQAGGQSDISQLITLWTAENPGKVRPDGPTIIVEPDQYHWVIDGPGLEIVKASFGRGKTFGFGYKAYYDARFGDRQGSMDVIYVNMRSISGTLQGKGIQPTREVYDLTLFTCAPVLDPSDFKNGGIDRHYLATDLRPIMEACSNYESKYGTLSTAPLRFNRFFYELANASSKRLTLIYDEVEGVYGQTSGAPDVLTFLESVLTSLRSSSGGMRSIFDEFPGKLNIVLLMQEVYYPSAERIAGLMSRVVPVQGFLYSGSRDGTVPVRYSVRAYLSFMESIVNELERYGRIGGREAGELRGAIEDPKTAQTLRNYGIDDIPARLAFQLIREVLTKVVSRAASGQSISADDIKRYLKELVEGAGAYTIFAGKKKYLHGEYIANAMEELLKAQYPYLGSNAAHKVTVMGAEGAYAIIGNRVEVLIPLVSDVRRPEGFLRRLVRHYGVLLDQFCSRELQRFRTAPSGQQEPCEVRILYLKGVRYLEVLDNELKRVLSSGLRSSRGANYAIRFNYKLVELTPDDFFSIVVYSNNDIPVIHGDRENYAGPRFREVKAKVFSGQG